MEPTERRPEGSNPDLSARQHSDRRWMEEQRALIQEALWEGEERLQALLDDAMVAVYIKDLQGRYLMINRWAEIMFRVTREEVVGKTDHELFPKEMADALRANDSKALEAEAPMRFEQSFLHEDGEYTYETTKFPLCDSDGNLYAVCSLVTDATELKQTGEALRESEARFRRIFECTAMGISIADLDRRFLETNPAYQRMLGYNEEELYGKPIAEVSHPDDVPTDTELHEEVLAGNIDRYQSEKRYIRKDGELVWVRPTISVVRDAQGEPQFLIGIVEDITERKRAEEQLKESEERYRAVTQQSVESIFLFDAETKRILESNTASQKLLGYTQEELLGMTIYDLLAHDPEEIDASVERDLREKRRFVGERKYRLKDGSLVDVEVSTSVIPYRGREALCMVARDVTERKALEEQLRHRAFHDGLTELPNRALFLERLQHALYRSDRVGGPVAVLFVDLDDFKVVNYSLGHDAGNALLVGVAGRLRDSVRPGARVVRLFGDEFAVLLEAPTGVEDARRITERIAEQLRASFEIDGEEVCVTPSVGIALSETVEEQPEELVRQADLAMYAAKNRAQAQYEVFEETMSARARERSPLENELRRAVERKEFEVYYQPIVELGSGRIDGVEALVRCRHPERGLISLGVYLPRGGDRSDTPHRPMGPRRSLPAGSRVARITPRIPLMSVNFSMERFGHQPDLVSKVLTNTRLDPDGL